MPYHESFDEKFVEYVRQWQTPSYFSYDYSNKDPKCDRRVSTSYLHHHFYRYHATYQTLLPLLASHSNVSVIDLGSFPGILQKLLDDLISVKPTLTGLGFSAEFLEFFVEWQVQEFDFEEDVPKERQEEYDVCTCFNIIEHMLFPNKLLDHANSFTRPGGHIVLTTDNLTTLPLAKKMLFGGSPNVPLLSSHIFFNGPWRPHMRIYSLAELQLLLNYSGFRLVSHRFFDHRGHQYANPDLQRLPQGLKQWMIERIVYRTFPHFMDHHLVVAEKLVPFAELDAVRPQPTDDGEEWQRIRKNGIRAEIFEITK
jgi:SAM-dependent methyltransferase